MRYKYTGRMKYEVILRRSRGRFVKSVERDSAYAAKKLAGQWDEKYDLTYEIEIRPVERIVVVK
jgi:hypothetical protein